MFHTGFVCGLALGSKQAHYIPQCSGIHTIPIKTQATIFHNLNSFSLKMMYNVALVEYLTVSVVISLLQLPQ